MILLPGEDVDPATPSQGDLEGQMGRGAETEKAQGLARAEAGDLERSVADHARAEERGKIPLHDVEIGPASECLAGCLQEGQRAAGPDDVRRRPALQAGNPCASRRVRVSSPLTTSAAMITGLPW